MGKGRSMRCCGVGAALVLLVLCLRPPWAPAQDTGTPPAAAGQTRLLLTVGDAVAGQDRSFGLGFFGQDPVDPEQGVSIVHRAADDGTLFMTDYAGVSLVRFLMDGARTASTANISAAQPAILLDSSRGDPVDGVALARIIKVVTNRQGVSAVMALRADNTYAIYRLDQGGLIRLGFFPYDLDLPDVAIGDAGQVAYVAANADGELALFQTPVGGQPVEIMRRGQSFAGGKVELVSDLTSNGAGDLAFRVQILRPDEVLSEAVLRRRGNTLEVVAQEGDTVEVGRGAGVTARLDYAHFPLMGPDGTIVFQGGAANGDFVNFYAQRPGRLPQPLIPHEEWTPDIRYSDYAIDADGTVAVHAVGYTDTTGPVIYRVEPGGRAERIVDGRGNVEPVGGLAFAADGSLYFLARRHDLPRDRYGLFPVRLFQYRREADPSTAPVREVAISPTATGSAGLISITQQPVISAAGATFGALTGGSERFPVPTAGLFQVPLGRPAAPGATLVAAEADALPGAGRVGIPQDLSYTTDGNLVVDIVLPGGGAAAITLPSRATTASAARAQADAIVPLIATGQSLGQPDRKLLGFLGPFVPLGVDQQLVTARYSQGGAIAEGLFAVSRRQVVEALADTLRGGPNTRYTSFSEPTGQILDVPSVSPEGNVVFRAYEDRGSDLPQAAVFQWLRASGAVVRLLSEHDPVRLSPSDPEGAPFRPERWEAGPAGTAYVQASLGGGDAYLFRCSLRAGDGAVQVEPLVVPELTSVTGRSPTRITRLTEFATDRAGGIFVIGEAGAKSGLFRLDPSRKALEPLLMQGDPVPRFADGRELRGAVFEGEFTVSRDSARGLLLFRALVSSKQWPYARRGLFRQNAQGALEALIVEQVGVSGSREVTINTLSSELERQTANGTTAFALQDEEGRWAIHRSRPVLDAMGRPVLDSRGLPRFETKLVARDGQAMGDGRRLVALNAVPLLSRERLSLRSGPIFALNDAGDVAFFASDGQRWGVYEFSDR